MIGTLLLLGATGDLAKRFLFPALGDLLGSRKLMDGFRVIAADRASINDDEFRVRAAHALPPDALSYRRVDAADPSSLVAVLEGVEGPVAVYCALPPHVVSATIRSLAAAPLPPGSRVVLEKPFGEDLESARALNALIRNEELDAYRVDHVLAMETTWNLCALPRRNPFLARLWEGTAVERVEICWEETLALEGRAGYFDSAGVVKDVMQNHMLQLLALAATGEQDDDADLHRYKLDVLQSIGGVRGCRRARYTAGMLADGRTVGDYAAEPGVDASRNTETFAEVALNVDLPRWRGTSFVLRAGKALAYQRKLVRFNFRGGGALEIGIDGPRDVVLHLQGAARAPIELRAPSADAMLPPYAHVLHDVLSGNSVYAVGAQEAEESWRVLAPVLAAWGSGDPELETYPAGSDAP